MITELNLKLNLQIYWCIYNFSAVILIFPIIYTLLFKQTSTIYFIFHHLTLSFLSFWSSALLFSSLKTNIIHYYFSLIWNFIYLNFILSWRQKNIWQHASGFIVEHHHKWLHPWSLHQHLQEPLQEYQRWYHWFLQYQHCHEAKLYPLTCSSTLVTLSWRNQWVRWI